MFYMPPEGNPFLNITVEDISHLPDITFEDLNEMSLDAIKNDLADYGVEVLEISETLIPIKLAGLDFVKNVFTAISEQTALKQMQLYTLIENLTFRVEVWDGDLSESDDIFQIQIFDAFGLLYYEVGFEPLGIVGGGSVTIHSKD